MPAQLLACLTFVVLLILAGCSDAKRKATTEMKSMDKTAVALSERASAADSTSYDEPVSMFAAAKTESAEPTTTNSSVTTRPETPAAGEVKALLRAAERSSRVYDDVRIQVAPQVQASPVRYRAGTLTAGSFDDHARYRDYREYLSVAMQRDPNETLPRLGLGERIVVRVINEKNEPVNNATVVLHAADTQHDVASQQTTSDGRAVFLSSLDHFPTGGKLVARAVWPKPMVPQKSDGTPPQPTADIERTGGETTLVLFDTQRSLPQQLDLSLVIDTTGSMSDELEYLKTEIDAIAATVHKRFPNVDQRYSLVVYRDEGDEYVARKFDFTGSLSEFQTALSAQSAGGGGDYPEAMHLALEQADSLDWRKDNAARVIFLVADAPPHRNFSSRTVQAVQKLRAKGVTIFPVAASGVQDEAEFVLRGAAFLTRGRYLFLTDHSGVGNPHARPNVPDYEVERLDQLMIRMIAWKLSGEETGMQEILATSHGEDAETQPVSIPLEQNQTHESGMSTITIPSINPTSHTTTRPTFLGATIAELWQSGLWVWPNRYWMLALIVLGVIILDRREVRRRRAMFATTHGCPVK